VEGKAKNTEDDGEKKKASKLKRLPTDAIDCEDGGPVARDGPGTGEYNHPYGLVVQFVVQCASVGITNGIKNHGLV
jgi:hypothetical protein